jgi:uncharacterized protein YndB with AHSA1/START domain
MAGRTFEATLTRTLAASRERVWQAWTDPVRMAAWWGPRGFTNPVCEMDVRPGGRMWIVMRAPDGSDHPMGGVFHEVVRPERLVFLASPEDGEGVQYAHNLTTVTFAETAEGGTLLTVHSTVTELMDLGPDIARELEQGLAQSLVRLAALVDAD